MMAIKKKIAWSLRLTTYANCTSIIRFSYSMAACNDANGVHQLRPALHLDSLQTSERAHCFLLSLSVFSLHEVFFLSRSRPHVTQESLTFVIEGFESLCETWRAGLLAALSLCSPALCLPAVYCADISHVTGWQEQRSSGTVNPPSHAADIVVPCSRPRQHCHTSTIDITHKHTVENLVTPWQPMALFLPDTMGWQESEITPFQGCEKTQQQRPR